MYESTKRVFREELWEDFGAIGGLWGDPWCIGGDFHIIRFPIEHNREGRISESMRRFSLVIDDLDLKGFTPSRRLFHLEKGAEQPKDD